MIDALINRLEDFESHQDKYIEEAIKSCKDIIASENVTAMYEYGMTREHKAIVPHYAQSTIRIKQKKGQRTDHVTLRDTGAFHASIHLEFFNEGFEIKDDVPYGIYLRNRYTDKILGIGDEEFSEITEQIIKPYLKKKLQSIL